MSFFLLAASISGNVFSGVIVGIFVWIDLAVVALVVNFNKHFRLSYEVRGGVGVTGAAYMFI